MNSSNRSSNQSQGKANGKNRPKSTNNKPKKARKPRNNTGRGQDLVPLGSGPGQQGIPAAVRLRIGKKGMGDIIRHVMAWSLGFVYVGNGTNGAANAVLFQTTSGALLADASVAQPFVPILGSDTVLGKSYVSDITKHYARKVIHRMWLEVNALVPSTGSAMMVAIGALRGPSSCAATTPHVLATAGATAATLDSVTSIRDCMVLTSFENRTMEISHLIAGGSGPRQDEFNVASQNASGTAFVAATAVGATLPGGLEGIVPACIVVGGNNTVAAYQAQQMFEIVIRQEVSFLDYAGGSAQVNPLV